MRCPGADLTTLSRCCVSGSRPWARDKRKIRVNNPPLPEVSSDADFLVDFEPEPDLPPLEQFFGLASALERLLGLPVDMVESGAIKNPFVLADIDKARELGFAL